MDVQLIDPAIHGQGPGVACFAISFADPDDANAVTGLRFNAENFSGQLHSFDVDAGVLAATNDWSRRLSINTASDLSMVELEGFAGFNHPGSDLTPNNNPFLQICVEVDASGDACLELGGIIGVADNELGLSDCVLSFPQSDNGVICVSSINPDPCAFIDVELDYEGWSAGRHCFAFRFTNPSELIDVVSVQLEFTFSSRGGQGQFLTPAYESIIVDQTRGWQIEAESSVDFGPQGVGTIASFAAIRGNAPSPSADLSAVQPEFLKILVEEPDQSIDYCVVGLRGVVQFETPQGIVTCDLDQLMQNTEACSQGPTVAIAIAGNIHTDADCLGTGPGLEDVRVAITYTDAGNNPALCGGLSDAVGNYSCAFTASTNSLTRITPELDFMEYRDGLTANDLSLMERHILGVTPQSEWRDIIAMDVNADLSVDVRDILLARALLLSQTNTAPSPVWKFIPQDFYNALPSNPFGAVSIPPFDSYIQFNAGDPYNPNFEAAKTGDIDRDVENCIQTARQAPTLTGLIHASVSSEGIMGAYALVIPSGDRAGICDIGLSYEGLVPADLQVDVADYDPRPQEAFVIDEEQHEIRVVLVEQDPHETGLWDGRKAIVTLKTADMDFLSSLQVGYAETYDGLTGEKTIREVHDATSHHLSLQHQRPDVLHIDYQGMEGDAIISVHGITGQLVWRSALRLSAASQSIRLPQDMAAGLYLADVRVAGDVAVTKFIHH